MTNILILFFQLHEVKRSIIEGESAIHILQFFPVSAVPAGRREFCSLDRLPEPLQGALHHMGAQLGAGLLGALGKPFFVLTATA